MTKALVTGANGFVGSYVCKELLSNGYQVRALHRANSDTTTLEGLAVEKVVGDIRDKESLLKAFEGIEVVFHIAALFREAKHPDSVYRDINIEGTRNVFDAAIASNVKKVIHCSTVGVHSHIPNPPADETEAYRPGDIYQETKCEGEKLALSYFNSGKMKGSVIRPAMIWGPGDKRMLKLFRGIAARRLPVIGTGNTQVHWVMVDDLARGFRLAAEKDQANAEVFIIAGENPVKLRDMMRVIAEELGVTLLPFRIPALPLQILGGLMELICIPFGIEPPIYRRRVDFFTKTRAFSWDKARNLLDYKPSRTFAEEVAEIAAWYQNQGWLPSSLTLRSAQSGASR